MLRRGGEVLLRFPADALQLGVVAAIDRTATRTRSRRGRPVSGFTGPRAPDILPAMLGEAEGCEILHAVFRGRGYRTRADVEFAEDDVAFNADGWDPDARVGFEYLSSEAGDRKDLSPDETTRLAARMDRGELFFFIIDEAEVPDAATLRWAAERFLDEVARRRGGAA